MWSQQLWFWVIVLLAYETLGALGVSASASTLYLLSEEQPSPGKTNLNLLAVNVLNNSSSVVLQLPVPSNVDIVGTTFDQNDQLYYVAYNHKFSTNQSFISAIDVEAKEIVLDGYMFSEQQVVWDIDIDSAGNIHFLRKSSPVAFDNKFVVDYCKFDPSHKVVEVLVPAATLVDPYGSIAVSFINI